MLGDAIETVQSVSSRSEQIISIVQKNCSYYENVFDFSKEIDCSYKSLHCYLASSCNIRGNNI